MASALYEIQRAKKEATVIWLAHIHFDAFFEIPEKSFYFSTTDKVDFFLDGADQMFRGLLRDVIKGKHQRDRGQDAAQFSLVNDGNSTYQEFLDYEDIIERGHVTVYQCIEIEKGYLEGEIRFYGYLQDFTLNESEKSLDFTAVSDMSRTGVPVAARILTRERCGTEFNYGGLNPPEFHHCGWQLAMGGNPDFCSKFLKGIDGCVAHGNAHRFFAVTGLSGAVIEFVDPGDVGFPYDNRGCFTENMRVVLPDWSTKSIAEVKQGEIVLAHDVLTGELVETRVTKKHVHIVKEILIAEFQTGGTIETTAEHLFRIADTKYAPVGVLEGKRVQGLSATRKEARDALNRKCGILQRTAVYNLTTECSAFMITNKDGKFFYDVHNLKYETPISL